MKIFILATLILTSLPSFSRHEEGSCILTPSIMDKDSGMPYKGSWFDDYTEYVFTVESPQECYQYAIEILNKDLNLANQNIPKVEADPNDNVFTPCVHWEYITGDNFFTAKLFNPRGYVSQGTDPNDYDEGDRTEKKTVLLKFKDD